MEINGPGQPPLPPGSQPVSARALPWQNNQVLNAVLVRQEGKSLLLQIDNTLVKTMPTNVLAAAKTTPTSIEQLIARLQPGDPLSLKLVVIDGRPALKLLAPTPQPAEIIANAMRVALPKQLSLTPLLANLAHTQTAAGHTTAALLPTPIREAIQSVLAQLPSVTELRDPELLRRAILNSGLFVEQQLAQSPPADTGRLSSDVRVALTRLAALLRQGNSPTTPPTNTAARPRDTVDPRNPLTQSLPLPPSPAKSGAAAPTPTTAQSKTKPAATLAMMVPPSVTRPTPQPQMTASLTNLKSTLEVLQELFRQVEGSLARIQAQQLSSAGSGEAQRSSLFFELPLRTPEGIDMFQFRLHRDGGTGKNDASEASWSVSLAFELERLGPIRVLISLLQQNVSVSFWTESPQTQQLFNTHLQSLQENLGEAGLAIGRISCQTGVPGTAEFGGETRSPLMDEHA